ncbi:MULTISPECIES: N-methyl-L-tryptophan oxidase [unclassified Microbacterium]|uniref:N-methyl-L-tryptophan oxidase n=1 Tax=unclassified Microbacterium TaxID=2609290 RepID=UPI00097EB320|nr:N-methyl-L-tryptophan oxidase [Microbacterium sp. JB110]RCS57246.1 N-methyl-L-tryptophan oxidase [Microbacterium sp. JB110]SJM59035.1 Sarcosine oxidase [Frigoribacterium sp. JB110]
MESFEVAVVGMGAMGSAAAYHLARRGASVVAFEQYDLGHVRGASHDTSRIVRTSYGAPEYVRLAQSAYRDWADLEQESGERLLTVTGGVVFLPVDGPYSASDFTSALHECGVPYELLSPEQVRQRWPQFSVPDGVETVYTEDSGIAHAARTVATLQMRARVHGADIRDRTSVESIVPDGDGAIVRTSEGDVRAGRVIVAADAWTNALLEPLGAAIPLDVMQEQVTYFRPADPEPLGPDRLPVWIWEDEECYYGFPTYGEPTVKAGRDVSENRMLPQERSFVPSDELSRELAEFVGGLIPSSGPALRTVTCQYALTPNRRFVLAPVPQHPAIIVGLTAGHGFKFTPAIGRVLAELALDGESTDDVSAFGFPTP